MSENQKGNKDVGCKGAMKSFSTLKDYLEFVNEENQLPSSSSTLATTLLMPNSLQPLEGKRKLEALNTFAKAMCRDYDRAQRVELLSAALEVVPMFCEAYFWRGILGTNVLENRKDLQRALHFVSTSNPYKSLLIKSQIYAMKRNPDKAVEVLEEAMMFASNEGEQGEVYYFRTFANWWVDNDEDAIYDCQLSIQHHYNTKSCYTHLADMRKFLNAPNAELKKYYEESLLPTPRHTELVKYGSFLVKNTEVMRGTELLEAAIERNDASPDGYAQLAFVKSREHNLKQVLERDKFGQNVQQRCMLATMLAHDENTDDGFTTALNLLTDGIAINPCTELYMRRGLLLLESFRPENKDKGIEDLRMAVKLNASNSDAQFALARALELYGRKVTSPTLDRRSGDATNTSVAPIDWDATYDPQLESLQRYSNVVHLFPSHPKVSEAKKTELAKLNLPEFRFYPGEDFGLFKHLKYSSVYQYVGITRKALTLLIRFSEDKHILWSIFCKYTEQLYTWASSHNPNISEVAIAALDKLWKQTPDPTVYLSSLTARYAPGKWSTLNLDFLASRASEKFKKLDHVIVYSEVPESFVRTALSSMDTESYEAFLNFLYRSDTWVSSSALLQLFGLSRAIPVLDEFLHYNFNAVRRGLSPMDDCRFELRFSKIPKDLSAFVNNPQYSDVIFVLGEGTQNGEEDGEGEAKVEAQGPTEIPAHKVVLSKCAYFDGMFGTGLRESKQLRIPLADIGSDVFLEVLKFIYGGVVKFSGDNCIEILRVADILGLEDLKILCELFVGNHVDGDNKEDLLEISQIFNAPRLMQNCKRF